MSPRLRGSGLASILAAVAAFAGQGKSLPPEERGEKRTSGKPAVKLRYSARGKQPQRQGPTHIIKARLAAAQAKRERRHERNREWARERNRRLASC